MRDRAKPGQKRGDIMRIEGEEVTVMKEPVLVIMAAGMGSRYGGLKQIDPMDKEGHILIDFSLYDARKAGFHKVVFIIKKENEADFKAVIGNRIEKAWRSLMCIRTGRCRRDFRCRKAGRNRLEPDMRFFAAHRSLMARLQ